MKSKIAIVLGLLLIFHVVLGAYKSRTHVFVLQGGIALSPLYSKLLTALDEAKPGSHIKIILKKNPGGFIPTMRKIVAAMAKTKATVTTTFEGHASSSAMDILFSGDIIIIPKQPIGYAHLSSNFKGSDYWLIAELAHLRPYMTTEEWASFIADGDVPIYGKVVCQSKQVVRDHPTYCILKGALR